MNKKLFIVISVLIFQLLLASLPGFSIYAASINEPFKKINDQFFTEVSTKKNLIPVIVELQKEPTIDFVNRQKKFNHVDKMEETLYRNEILAYQKEWLNTIQRQGISFFKASSCTDVINMVSLEIKGTDLHKLLDELSVKKIYDDRYRIKLHRSIMAQSTGTDKIWKGTNAPKATGKDIIVGVIDTGMDGNHPEFTGKILGGQSYIDKSSYKTDSYVHGTHVAGIIGGLGDASHGKGMAPSVKFFSYKALGPNGGAASGIMDAMDQAVKDKCQIINMSLGRPGGEASKDGNPYYPIVKRIVAANVVLVASAGNSGARGKNVPWPAGSPGIVEDSFCVAASNDRNMRMTFSSSTQKSFQALYNPDKAFPFSTIQSKEIIDCGYGNQLDFSQSNIAGNIALIRRGPLFNPIPFDQKMENAKRFGAKAVIFTGNQDTSLVFPSFSTKNLLPYLVVSQEDGEFLSKESQVDTITTFAQNDGLIMADFSSMGLTPDGIFKPEIAAPGVNIMSTLPKNYGSYYAMSGTSMSAPSISGQIALIKEVHPTWDVDQIKSAMMNTAYIMMNPIQDKPVTFMLQGAGHARVDKAIQTTAFINPRAFVIEEAKDSSKTFTVTNASKEELTYKIKVEYFLDSEEENPVEIVFDKKEMSLSPNAKNTFTASIKIDKNKFHRPRIEGVIWINELHIPFIILRETSSMDNSKALKSPVSDVFCNTQQVDYGKPDQHVRVNFSFNTGSEQKYEGEISYSNYGTVKVFVTDQQGLEWDIRPIKEFKQCVIGDYSFEWDMMTASKEYLPNGRFSLKFECSASDDNQIVSEPLHIVNSPLDSIPPLILSSPRFIEAESLFALDLVIPEVKNISEIEYTLNFDSKKLVLEKAEKGPAVISWETPTYKSESIRLTIKELDTKETTLHRKKLATIYFSAKGIGPIKFTNKVYISVGSDKKMRSLAYLPEIQITKRSFLIGDVNSDKKVDFNDYCLLTKLFNTFSDDPVFQPKFDLNQDLVIDQLDLDLIVEDFGKEI